MSSHPPGTPGTCVVKHHRLSAWGGVGCTNAGFRPLFFPAGNVINTNCSAAHSRQALSCKMAVEYDKFIESGRK